MIIVEHCATGRLRDAYPVGEHDVEVRLPWPSVELLREAVGEVLAADPACRRVIHAVAEGDLPAIAEAEAAGYRHVVDVDLPGGQSLSLFVVEPGWVTAIDHDTDAMTHTASVERT